MGAPSAEWRLYGVLTAFVHVRLLTGRDFELWRGIFWNRDEEWDAADGAPYSKQTHLLRTVPGPQGRISGLRVTVVELYGDGVSLQWHLAPGRRGRPRLSVRAALGSGRLSLRIRGSTWRTTRARHTSGKAAVLLTAPPAEGGPRLGHTDFAPAAPKEASALRISLVMRLSKSASPISRPSGAA